MILRIHYKCFPINYQFQCCALPLLTMASSQRDSQFGIKNPHRLPGMKPVQGTKQIKKSFPPANPAQIMRSAQKDQAMISNIEQEVAELFREVLRNSKREQIIEAMKHFSHFLYYGCTSLSGLQTLGEEYSGILMLSEKGSLPSKLKILEMVLLKCFGGVLMSFILSRGILKFLSKDQKAQSHVTATNEVKDIESLARDIIFCMPALNTALFYLNGDYYDIPKRLTGIHYVLVHIWLHQLKDSHSAFKILGVVSLLYSLTQLVQAITKHTHQMDLDEINNEPMSTSSTNDESKCPFCFEIRKNPAVTPCGHLFCWKCIMHALQVDNKCPLCRESVCASRVVLLRNY